MELSKKKVCELANTLEAKDITYTKHEEIKEIERNEKGFVCICFSGGTYGVTSWLGKGRASGNFYLIRSRVSNLYIVM